MSNKRLLYGPPTHQCNEGAVVYTVTPPTGQEGTGTYAVTALGA